VSNSNRRVNVVRIAEILTHPNADTLGLVHIGGYQCVVKKDAYKAGDLAVYIQPDSIVPQTKAFEFLWADKEFPDGVVPERYRRITVRRFRKEWSEGLLLPVSDVLPVNCKATGWDYEEGQDVADIIGITHYVEPEPVQNINRTKIQYQSPLRSWRGFLYWLGYKLGIVRDPLHGANAKPPKNAPPVYDVESLKNYPNTFSPLDRVWATEKIHGSNARYFFDGKKMWVGSKNLWKSEKSTCIWRRALRELPWIEQWCREHPNYTLFAEITPTQKGYAYGCKEEAMPVRVFVFDIFNNITRRYEDKDSNLFYEVTTVPTLYIGQYDAALIQKFVDGPSMVLASNQAVREGIVIALEKETEIPGLGRAQLKLKSLKFLEKEGKC
jgi:hypothetical protein